MLFISSALANIKHNKARNPDGFAAGSLGRWAPESLP